MFQNYVVITCFKNILDFKCKSQHVLKAFGLKVAKLRLKTPYKNKVKKLSKRFARGLERFGTGSVEVRKGFRRGSGDVQKKFSRG